MSDQLLESAQGSLKEITLISSTGKKTDIKAMCQDFVLIEDIFMPTLYGEIHIKDSQNLPIAFDVHGNEFVFISLQTPSLKPIEKYFRVYSITDLRFHNATSFEYIIHFCSEESILNQQILISKSYKNLKNSDIVSDILKNKLMVNEKKIAVIEQTNSQENIIVPNMKPFEAINWVSSFSINGTLGSAFLFFESIMGFNFISLETLAKQKPYKPIKIAPKNTQINDTDKSVENRFIVDRFEIISAFDIQEALFTGAYSSSMLKLQVHKYKYETIKFDIGKNNYSKLNTEFPVNNAKNRLDKTLANGSAYMRYYPSFQGNLTDKWILQRASQLSMLNSLRMRLQMSGDSQMPVGSVIQLDFPLVRPTDTPLNIERDLYRSGNYLVTKIKHRYFGGKYLSYIEVSKDSLFSAIPAAVASSPSYDTAKKS